MNPKTQQTNRKTCTHKSQRAKARWAILRDAILQDRVSSTTKQQDRDLIENATNDASEYSIHRFPGFQLLRREKIKKKLCEKDYNWDFSSPMYTSSGKDTHDIVQYIIEVSERVKMTGGKLIRILTRERQSCSKVSIKEMMSHVHYGVDNTGNTRVWDSSNVLAFIIIEESSQHVEANVQEVFKSSSRIDECSFISGLELSSNPPLLGLRNILSLSLARCPVQSDSGDTEVLKVLELGAGMAALPGLALISLANSCEEYNDGNLSISVPFIDLTITDGHPAAVANNVICAAMTTNMTNKLEVNSKVTTTTKSAVKCCTLLWKANSEGASECTNLMRQQSNIVFREENETCRTELEMEMGFDLIMVSDCIHFTDFHADLVVTIGRMLRIGGVCILCQPCRGDSLRKFITLIEAMNENSYGYPCKNEVGGDDHRPLFQVDLHMKYCRRLVNQHEALLENHHRSRFYDPNIHYPLVLTLRKMRAYNEKIDTAIAVNHVKSR